MDLTYRCNLACVHCYAGPGKRRAGEMSAALALRILAEISDAGCLFLLLTGGEPLIRRDFARIYRAAVERGMLVTLFTNATRVTGETIALLKDLPPRSVEVTIYGSRPETHDAVTGVAGSFDRCIRGVTAMRRAGVRLRLKTILMTLNTHDARNMRALADDMGVPFRMDACLFPKRDGDASPLRFRVAPETAVAEELADAATRDEWTAYYRRVKGVPPTDALYECGCGISSFHVDAFGNLMPCLMARSVRFDLRSGCFRDGWQNVIPGIRNIQAGRGYPCGVCERKGVCSACPGFFEMENGDGRQPSRYVCEVGTARYAALQLAG
jgi:MoaA/NifB/PqqE/SkfB family radical SAM enzyme